MHNYDVGRTQRVKQTFSILNFSVFLLNKEIYLSLENMPNILNTVQNILYSL